MRVGISYQRVWQCQALLPLQIQTVNRPLKKKVRLIILIKNEKWFQSYLCPSYIILEFREYHLLGLAPNQTSIRGWVAVISRLWLGYIRLLQERSHKPFE